MKLTSLINNVPEYLEYGWVCAPNAAGQAISANTITACTIDTEIADEGNNGGLVSNQVILVAGVYEFVASIAPQCGGGGGATILGLYNATDGVYVTRNSWQIASGSNSFALQGRINISSNKAFELRVAVTNAVVLKSAGDAQNFTISTAGADQRNTIKLWKLA